MSSSVVRTALEARIAKTDAVLAEIGGQLSDDEAKGLMPKKLCDTRNEIAHLPTGKEGYRPCSRRGARVSRSR